MVPLLIRRNRLTCIRIVFTQAVGDIASGRLVQQLCPASNEYRSDHTPHYRVDDQGSEDVDPNSTYLFYQPLPPGIDGRLGTVREVQFP